MSGDEYEALRAGPARFAVASAAMHVAPEVERIVDRNERFWTVEKFGRAGEIATQLDLRSGLARCND